TSALSQLRCLANGRCQVSNRCRGHSKWIALFLAAFQKGFRSFFCGLDALNQLFAIGALTLLWIVFGTQLCQVSLNNFSPVGFVVVFQVKDQPQLEARIGITDPNTIRFAELNSLLNLRVLISVKNRPDLISLFE